MNPFEKIYRDESTDKEYYFHSISFNREFINYCKKNEMQANLVYAMLESNLRYSASTFKAFRAYKNEEKFRAPNDITVCKSLGRLICDDEYAFLVPCGIDNSLINMEKDIQEIYKMLYGVLALYDVSDCFNVETVVAKKNNSEHYFDKLLDDIQKEICTLFLFRSEVVKCTLIDIVESTRIFIKSNSVPGVVDKWLELNPNLKYYDCIYDILEKNPEYFNKIKYGLDSGIIFHFIPNEEEIKCRKEYFNNLNKKNVNYNYKYSEERFFKEELLNTLSIVFKANFENLKDSTL